MGGEGDVRDSRGLEWSKFCFAESLFVENGGKMELRRKRLSRVADGSWRDGA